MISILPIAIGSLIRDRSIESVRVEFKANWSADVTGFQVLKTLCAFANDYQNLNGGYVVIGVAESEGRARLPPAGLSSAEIESAQRWIRGRCRAMQPSYEPIMSPEVLEGRDVLVVWAPASEARPHRAPDGPDSRSWKFWIRIGSETVDAEAAGKLAALLEQTARVPWDDRPAHRARIEDLREGKVREHLHDIRSALRDEPDISSIYRRMRITTPVNEHDAPRNVGLLFFSDDPEPTKVCMYPDRMEVISYPGPVAGIEPHHLAPNTTAPPPPARNRRVGEFLKQLGLAEAWWTGLPRIYRSMADNGSPAPRFDFDPGRTWFRATLPAHPEYAAVSALQDAAYLRTVGATEDAYQRVLQSWQANDTSAVLAAEMIRLHSERHELGEAGAVFTRFDDRGPRAAVPNVANTWIEALLDHGRTDEAQRLLEQLAGSASAQDAVDAAILARRLHRPRTAHRYFQQAGEAIRADSRALHEFAQTKIQLAQDAFRKKQRAWRSVNRRLLVEARGLLERVIQLDASPHRHAWAWRDMARLLTWLRVPANDVESAFRNAIRLLPDEPRFPQELQRFRDRQHQRPL